MSSLPQIFNYETLQIRVVTRDGEPWFVAKDVCDILELGDTGRAIDGERDFGTVEFEAGGSACFAILTGDQAAIECVVYDGDHEVDKIHGIEIEYCPWCGRKLT